VDKKGQGALIDLTFNMGPVWFKKWPNFVKQLSAGNTQGAADSLEDSTWYKQVKSRAVEIVGLIRNSSKDGAATAVAANTPESGKIIAETSTTVASAKKAQQTGSSVTVIAVNNNTQTKVGATNRSPQTQTTAVVGA
jgi:hypothetical protein